MPRGGPLIALLQRVSRASVTVAATQVGAIGPGLLVLVGVQRGDAEPEAERLLERVLGYRMFSDRKDRMNLSVCDVGGGLLLVPQFTLPADTSSGMRPSFSTAARTDIGHQLFTISWTAPACHRWWLRRGSSGSEWRWSW